MVDTSVRLLRLLSLLQTNRNWSGTQLAGRLGVSTRTVRTDISRLRSLGYTVASTPGVAGGYRLRAGAVLPPQLLDDDEVVAVAVGLGTAGGGTVAGIEESSVRALAKLEQVMPARLRHRVHTLQAAMVALPSGAKVVRPEALTAIAAACRDHVLLRLDYVDRRDISSVRTVEPHRLVHAGQRWYLVAFDLNRCDWRSFRVDRLTPRIPTGPRFVPRQLPEPDIATYVTRGRMAAPELVDELTKLSARYLRAAR